MQKNINDKLFTSVFKRKDFGINLIWIGSLFLINPVYGLFDILPDFIGLILIYNGLTKLSDLDIRLEKARQRFFYSIFVGCAMFLLMILVSIFNFDQTTGITITLAGMILWTIFLIPGYMNLFEGLSYLKLRSKNIQETIHDEETHKNVIFTIVFLLIRAFFTLAPDLTIMVAEEISRKNGIEYNTTLIKAFVLVISFAIILVFGIIWLIKLRKHLISYQNEAGFLEYLNNRYDNEIACDKHLFNVRKIKMFSILCIVAYALTICFPSDGYHIIPEFAFAICMFFAFFQARDYISDRKQYNKTLLLFLITSFITYVLRIVYTSNFWFVNLPFLPKEADPKLFWPIYLSCLIFGTGSYLLLIKISKQICKTRENMIDECVGLKLTNSEYRIELDTLRRKELKIKSKVVYVIQVIYAIVSIVSMALIPFVNVIIPFALYWAYRLLTCIVCMVGLYVIGSDLNDEAEKMI